MTGRRHRALFHKVIREGLYEKVTFNLEPEYKIRGRFWETAFQAEGRDSANVLRYGWNRMGGGISRR